MFYEYLTYVLFNQIWFPCEECNLVYVSNIINRSEARRILVYINKYNYICYIVDFRCCVTLDKVGECVIYKLGTVVVVVVGLYADIHRESFILMHRWGLMPWNVNHSPVEGLCLGMLVIHLLRAYALGCFNHPNCWGLMPWNALSFKRVKCYHIHTAFVVVVGALSESLLVSRRSCSGDWLGWWCCHWRMLLYF